MFIRSLVKKSFILYNAKHKGGKKRRWLYNTEKTAKIILLTQD